MTATFENTVREWVAANLPDALAGVHIDMYGVVSDDPAVKDAFELWRARLAAQGWGAPTWPREYGGAGLTDAEAKVISRAIAKAGSMNPIPYLSGMGVTMVGPTRAPGDEELLADLDDLDELGGVGVEVHHVAGLLGRLRPGVHGDPHIRGRQGGSVVGAVAGHRHQAAALLLAADEGHLVLRGGLGEEVVDAGFGRDRLGGQGVVAGDHDGADPERPQLVESLLHAGFHHVLQVHDAKDACTVGNH
jgi:hypothetical protein